MPGKDGKHTGEFGTWLVNYYQDRKDPGYTIFYDHGDPDLDPHVAAVKGIFSAGEEHPVSSVNRLADIDVLVANQKQEALLLIEIEESEMAPKKILGDIFTILSCNQAAVRAGMVQKYFKITPNTRLIIAGILSRKGIKLEKINQVILPRLQAFSAPEDSVPVDQVEIISGKDIQDALDELRERLKILL